MLMQPNARRHWPATAKAAGLDPDDERYNTPRKRRKAERELCVAAYDAIQWGITCVIHELCVAT